MSPTLNIAVRAAREAGNILLRFHQRIDSLTVREKQTNDYVSEVDQAAEDAIIYVLKKAFPDHAILAEESGSHEGNEHEWIIDPLDGTTNYLRGVPQFAVSIAMRHRGELQIAVVYDPLKDELFTAEAGAGAYLNGRRIRVNDPRGLKGALLGTGIPFRDQRYIDAYLGMLKDLIVDAAGVRRPGSAALDFAWLAAGRFDGFWELGLSAWDFAAGALLVKEAGGMVTDITGGDRYLETGNVIAASPRLHNLMVKTIKPHLVEGLTGG
ncbi:MAG: inositol monophosphatase family protein [bacterium]